MTTATPTTATPTTATPTTATPRTPTRTTRPPAPWQLPPQLREMADEGLVASVYLGTHRDVREGAHDR